MTPERFLHFILLIIAVVVAVVLAVWFVNQITGADPGFVRLMA